jgi:tetratricopeptide (TPR) repeat protein
LRASHRLDDALTLTVRGGRLFGKRTLRDEFELYAVSRDELVRKEYEIGYHVERSKGGVVAIQMTYEGEKTTARRASDGTNVPSSLLEEGNLAAMRMAYLQLFAESPEDHGISEPHLNSVGYDLAGRQEFAKAIAVLRVNNELRPASANTYDSLAEVYLMSGDRTRALETYRKELEVLPTDTTTTPALKERLRHTAEEKVKELER